MRSVWFIALIGIICSAFAFELGYRTLRGPTVNVTLINRTGTEIRDLALQVDSRPSKLSRLGANTSKTISVTAFGSDPLVLQFQKEGQKSDSWNVSSFDGRAIRANGQCYVIEIEPENLTRYSEDDDRFNAQLTRLIGRWTTDPVLFPF